MQIFENMFYLDFTSLLIVLIFFLFLEYRPPWWNKQIKPFNTIPGPRSLPVIGTTWTFIFSKYSLKHLHKYYQEFHEKYGPIAKEESLGNVQIIHLFGKNEIVKVLKNSSRYPLRPPCEAVVKYRKERKDRYSTVGLVNAQGVEWQCLRNILNPIFTSPKTISDFLPEVKEIAVDWINLIRKVRQADTNRVNSLMLVADRLSLEITCTLILGRRMGFLLPETETQIGKDLSEAIRQHFVGTRDTYYGLPFWKFFPTQAYEKLVKSEEAIYDLALELIKSADKSTEDSPVFQSILKSDLDEKEKIATIIDFMAAGIHTLKNTLVFLLHLVGERPDLQNMIVEDTTLTYSKACLTESFRFLPTTGSLARILEEDIMFGDYKAEAGSVVVCHSGIACRDERYFPQANKFRPERWLDEEKTQTVTNSLFLMSHFGSGRRICPGKRFIEQIIPILLDTIVRNFEIVVENELEVEFEFLLTPKSDMSLVFNDRIF